MDRNLHPRHASCIRTCRAGVPVPVMADVERRHEMILKLKVTCVRGAYLRGECIRIIAMEDFASLADLHEMIQDAVLFDRDHPFDFYTANSASPWAEKNRLTDVEDWDERESVFHRTQLKDAIPTGRKKLYYWFDFGDDWIFEIRRMRLTKADATLSTPRIIERIGVDPEQYPSCNE